MRIRTAFLAAALAATPVLAQDKEGTGLVVHEWGTFTSLQNESGKAIGGINSDDEPVPGFVHRISSGLITSELNLLSKGLYGELPSVTMRLETPVLYFHPGSDVKLPIQVDVHAQMHGGWLSEYYPNAAASTEHYTTPGVFKMGPLTSNSLGKLHWAGLTVGTDQPGPQTNSKVWTAPRQVKAASVLAGKEAEKYLFYRGVAHLDAPLRVAREGGLLHVYPQLDPAQIKTELTVSHAWLADIKADGSCAIRSLPPMTLTPGSSQELVSMPAVFDSTSYGSIQELRVEMHSALVAEGLFDDEAEAMLNTWEASYFKSPGLRLFFMVPRGWTDQYLPLQIDGHGTPVTAVKRAMIGRLELVTPRQRELLRQLSTPGKIVDTKAYTELGRFRDALMKDQASRKQAH